MDGDTLTSRRTPFVIGFIILLLLLIFAVAIFSSRDSRPEPNTAVSSNQTEPTGSEAAATEADAAPVKDLVTYRLPDGWSEQTCPLREAVYFVPDGEEQIDCEVTSNAVVTMSLDAANTDDCNDLQNPQFVSRHVCSSLYINDMFSLVASTTYNQESSFGRSTTFDQYYINTGSGIIKLEYMHDGAGSGSHMYDFEQLARSVDKKD